MNRNDRLRAGFAIRVALAIAALASALGCGATAPDYGDSSPIRYDVTTSDLTYSYPVITPGCSSTGCGHETVESPNSSLSGTIVLSDLRPLTSGDGFYGTLGTSLSEVDCGTGTACKSRLVAYKTYGFSIAADTLSQWASFVSDGEYVYLTTGRVSGDDITGTIYWATASGTASAGYQGTYVARRRR